MHCWAKQHLHLRVPSRNRWRRPCRRSHDLSNLSKAAKAREIVTVRRVHRARLVTQAHRQGECPQMIVERVVHVSNHCEPTIPIRNVGGDEVQRRRQRNAHIENRSVESSQSESEIAQIERERQSYQSTSYPSNLFSCPLCREAGRIEDLVKRFGFDARRDRIRRPTMAKGAGVHARRRRRRRSSTTMGCSMLRLRICRGTACSGPAPPCQKPRERGSRRIQGTGPVAPILHHEEEKSRSPRAPLCWGRRMRQEQKVSDFRGIISKFEL